MTTFPNAPRLLKGGLVLLNPKTNNPDRIIALQYNPEEMSRTLKGQSIGEGADRAEALRLTGPPIETINIKAVIDAADQLEKPASNQTTVKEGILPQLAALEMILYPDSGRLEFNNALASIGTIEISPVEAPLTVFVWSNNRVMPVRITDYSVTEKVFDPNLNPLNAEVTLGMRVLNVNDLGFNHHGGSLYMNYQKRLEELGGKNIDGTLNRFGISNRRL